MQTDEATLQEVPRGHLAAGQSVIVGIADDETREDEEEIHSQITVIDDLVGDAFRVGLEQVEAHHQDGCYATETVQNLVSRL